MWDIISSLSTLVAVLVALFLPYWEHKYKLKVDFKEKDNKYTYLIQNNSSKSIKITEIKYRMIQQDGLYSSRQWKTYNFYMKDKMSDDFGITWNEEFKEKEEQRHFLKPADGIIQEIGKTSLMFMDKDNSQKEHHPDAYKYGILWLEVIIHTGKRFKSRKMITKITKNTEYDEKSPNFDPPKNENYYEYDRFGNLIHQPPEIKSNE